ncbi:MAG: hypothetical protein CL678_15420 [Bdellovibrionaceae bacterium]|nr:hypothetical protein [Pseudobdellovibrionaceae bacterium]|tara:strand:+ start:1184 stop:1495 length:312 start_codon:yes stop_codon:yes gene_type:complete
MKFTLGALVVTVLLMTSGCKWFAKEETTSSITFTTPRDELLKDCDIAKPPSRAEYNRADIGGKLYLVSKSYREQVKLAHQCSVRLRALRDWKKEMEALKKEGQ